MSARGGGRRHKFNAKAVQHDCPCHGEHRHPSLREATRCAELHWAWHAGGLQNLRLQPRYPLTVNGQRVATYVADFEYQRDGRHVVEDAKGVRTPVYVLKRALMRALYAITVEEV